MGKVNDRSRLLGSPVKGERVISDTPIKEQDSVSILPALVSVNVHLAVLLILAFWVMRPEVRDKPVVLQLNPDSDEQTTVFEDFEIKVVEPVTEPQQELEQEIQQKVFSEVPKLELEPVVMSSIAAINSDMSKESLLVSLQGLPGTFADRIQDAHSNGIEIVIVFDATGSMGREINVVKERILTISETVLAKIPKARFSLVAYRDGAPGLRRDGSFLSKGIRLGNDSKMISAFMNPMGAGGGGDHPEAVFAGMDWAIHKNNFRSESQKVMLIFGDAPPHDTEGCIRLARKFSGYQKGIVHTITCRSVAAMPEFYEIAAAGRGRAFTMGDSKGLAEELIVTAFGQQHRNAVINFFELNLQKGAAKFESERSRRRKKRLK